MAFEWLQRLWRPYRPVGELGALIGGRDRRVEIEGRVETVAHLVDPLSGESCIALEYHAWPPATTMGVDGANAHGGRAYQVNARQAVEFMLVDTGARVLVRPDLGEDVAGLHERLVDRYGVGLRAETEMVMAGQRLRVAGEVVHRSGGSGTPHRELPYGAIVRAERIRVL